MKSLLFISPEGKPPAWAELARDHYLQKIKPFSKLEWRSVKSPSIEREQASRKIAAESESILKAIKPQDFVVLLDEGGKTLNTEQFSKNLLNWIENPGGDRVVFIVGGAFGVNSAVNQRANLKLNLAPWVLAHPVAQVVLLEQVYRAFAIHKGIPYHNARIPKGVSK